MILAITTKDKEVFQLFFFLKKSRIRSTQQGKAYSKHGHGKSGINMQGSPNLLSASVEELLRVNFNNLKSPTSEPLPFTLKYHSGYKSIAGLSMG